MILPEGWYAVAESNELKRGRPLNLECFGMPLVLWRCADSSPVAMVDRCPHRSAKLSLGEIVDESAIRCPFHGFEFSADGSCGFVPETESASTNLVVKTFDVRDQYNFIWMWCGSSIPSDEVSWFPALLKADWSYASQAHVWPTHISRCVENQLDYAHLPFVHRNTIGHNAKVSKLVEFDLGNDSICFFPGGRNKQQASIEFRFPNVWMLTIIPEQFAQVIAFVPMSERSTKLYLRSYQSFCKLPGLASIVNTIIRWQSRSIIQQDRRVVLSQFPQNSMVSTDEKLFPSDGAIIHFRKRWREMLEQKASL